MSLLEDARSALLSGCDAQSFPNGVHTVCFQPKPDRINEDRYIVEEWDDIVGPPWTFLAVLDGHVGADTAEYTKRNLPTSLRSALRSQLSDSLNINPGEISNLLLTTIEEFDYKIGSDAMSVCPHPERLEENDYRELVDGSEGKTLRRAFCGTTLAAVLIDGDKKELWAIGLGDSSVVLSMADRSGNRTGQRLLKLHNTTVPSEYARVVLSHPREPNIMKDQRVLGVLAVTRAIGDFSFKYRPSYTKAMLEQVLWRMRDINVHNTTSDNSTPPYISATSEVRHIDLSSLEGEDPTLLLYTDGVNNIIEGSYLFRKENPCKIDPAIVVSALLQEPLDDALLAGIFDHAVESKWNSSGNRAVELLGNMLGGRDAARLQQVLNPELLSLDGDRDLYIDDTTIIFCPLGRTVPTG